MGRANKAQDKLKTQPYEGQEEVSVPLREERMHISKEPRVQQVIRAGKHIETEHVAADVPQAREDAEMERVGPNPNDSGDIETLPDGSLSIPILEEELVVTKRTVVRERVIIRKTVHTEQARVEGDLKRERLDIQADPGALAPDQDTKD